jgi:hypothetical protein
MRKSAFSLVLLLSLFSFALAERRDLHSSDNRQNVTDAIVIIDQSSSSANLSDEVSNPAVDSEMDQINTENERDGNSPADNDSSDNPINIDQQDGDSEHTPELVADDTSSQNDDQDSPGDSDLDSDSDNSKMNENVKGDNSSLDNNVGTVKYNVDQQDSDAVPGPAIIADNSNGQIDSRDKSKVQPDEPLNVIQDQNNR